MSNPMAEANVSIIDELKKFIDTVEMESSLKSQYCISTKAFTRKRILTLRNTAMLIINGLKRSLSVEVRHFFERFSPENTCTKQAFCEQRAKLKPAFFHDCNNVLTSGFYRHYGEHVKRWKGMILYAVDGSSVPLPETQALRGAFGVAINQVPGKSSVTARICLLYDVLNGLIVKGYIHSYDVSEEDAVPECLSDVALTDRLLLFDRGYPSFRLMYLLVQRSAKFVMRVQRNASDAVKRFLASHSTDMVTAWRPSYKSLRKLSAMGISISKEASIPVRMVKVLLDTVETEVLITNLYDRTVYTKEDLKQVYHLRWSVETGYGYLKEELELGQFSGIRSVCIEQDFAATIFLFNLQSLVEKPSEPYVKAVSRRRKYRYKVNKNVSWGLLKDRVVRLFICQDSRHILHELEKLFARHLEPIRPDRKYPRVKKRKPQVKYYTLTNYKRAL
jgi:hypothetical protein